MSGGQHQPSLSGALPSAPRSLHMFGQQTPYPGFGVPLPGPGSVPGLRASGTEAYLQASTPYMVVAPLVHTELEQSEQRSAMPNPSFLHPQFAPPTSSRRIQLELPYSRPPGLPMQAARPAAAKTRQSSSASSLWPGSQQQAGTPGPALDGRGHPSGGRKDDRVPPERTREACGSPQVCNLFLLTCLSHQCQKHSIRM